MTATSTSSCVHRDSHTPSWMRPHTPRDDDDDVSSRAAPSKSLFRRKGARRSSSASAVRKRNTVPSMKKQSHTRDTVPRGRHLRKSVCGREQRAVQWHVVT